MEPTSTRARVDVEPRRFTDGLVPALPVAWRLFKDAVKRPFYSLYERRLASQVHTWDLPRHIGIIMDGNRRYARDFGRARALFGHARGAEKLREVLTWCYDAGIPVVTVWSFSLDNFQRGSTEVEDLLTLFEERTRELARHSDIHDNKVRVRYIGQTELLPESLQEAIEVAEHATRHYDKFQLNIAMAYGGREEITDAFRNYLADRKGSGASLEEVLEEFGDDSIEPYLYTSGQPEPDLILRTSGEIRMSGFLLWQSAYSEFYFSDTYWPAFRKIDLYRALRAFGQRHRRMGR